MMKKAIAQGKCFGSSARKRDSLVYRLWENDMAFLELDASAVTNMLLLLSERVFSLTFKKNVRSGYKFSCRSWVGGK